MQEGLAPCHQEEDDETLTVKYRAHLRGKAAGLEHPDHSFTLVCMGRGLAALKPSNRCTLAVDAIAIAIVASGLCYPQSSGFSGLSRVLTLTSRGCGIRVFPTKVCS